VKEGMQEGQPEFRQLFGIETEYGIIREDVDESDPVVESMELVRCHKRPFRADWDYSAEDPMQDARGFRVKTLQQEQEELDFEKLDRHRPFSFHEMKSDLMLENGARFYNDHTHPEYSTPECSTLLSLIAHDRAGERILRECAIARNKILDQKDALQLYKNNTDFHGHSYGCHDNYLLPRSLPFEALVQHLIPFLVTRQIFAGAGKIGIEDHRGYTQNGFQLSQRADFFETEISIDTMHARPILNTRDEPHADPALFRRLHLILGDSNMSEYTTALKIGTTSLVLRLIEKGLAPTNSALREPVNTLKALSRDCTLKQNLPLNNGKHISSIDHQRLFLEAARKAFSNEREETSWILQHWESTLDALDSDPMQLTDRIDWVTKKWLLETFMDAENCDWSDSRLPGLDLEYHNIDPERGLYLGLEMDGQMRRFVTDADIKKAMSTGPRDSRSGLRGLIVQKFLKDIKKIQWEKIVFSGGKARVYKLDPAMTPDEIETEMQRIESCRSVKALMEKSAETV